MEGQLGTTWWETQKSFPLSQAANLFDGSADWLRGLAEQPLADTASAVSVPGPMVKIGTGVTANFVTASVTAPLGDAARICEIAGIVIGFATGNIPLVIVCGKLLVHDALGDVLAEKLEQIIAAPGANSDRAVQPDERNEPEAQISSPRRESPSPQRSIEDFDKEALGQLEAEDRAGPLTGGRRSENGLFSQGQDPYMDGPSIR
jgi:hypothetical protein